MDAMVGATVPGHDEEPVAEGSAAAADPEVEEALRQLRGGAARRESFRPIYLRYLWPVTRFFTNRGFSRESAEDLAQEALIRVYTHIGTFRADARFEAWLFRIVGNVWKNELRSRDAKKRKGKSVAIEEMADHGDMDRAGVHEPADPAAGPHELLLERERQQLLAAALAKLPERMRECVLLRLGQDLKYREIAAVQQISLATVKTHLSTAYERLKPLLEQHYEDFEL